MPEYKITQPEFNARPLHALAHVYTQLTYQKTPLGKIFEAGKLPPTPLYAAEWEWQRPLESYSVEDWMRLLTHERRFPSNYLPDIRAWPISINSGVISQQIFAHVQACHRAGAHYLLVGDAHYPPLLRATESFPLGLLALGNLSLLARGKIAVVGSRKASVHAIEASSALGGIFAQLGVVTVSGGAYGCDIAAHQGVLEKKFSPALAIVVFAQGLAKLYPQGNYRVFRALLQQGGLMLSERLWHQEARPVDFPIRNRIISGLVSHTILMQADQRSGALTTAHRALDQGREVLVYRHAADDVRARGSAQLIEEGASSFATLEELFELLGISYASVV